MCIVESLEVDSCALFELVDGAHPATNIRIINPMIFIYVSEKLPIEPKF
jgi:hypothetical protein